MAAAMKLVAIDTNILINPERISHVKVEIMPVPTPGHDYPVMIVTMVDGAEYSIARQNDYVHPNHQYMFQPFESVLRDIIA
jgi:hypothetical protein